MTTPEPTPDPIPEPRGVRSPRGRRVGVVLAAIALVLATGLWWWHRPPPPAAPRLLLPIIEDGKWGMIDADTGAVAFPPTWLGGVLPYHRLSSKPLTVEELADYEEGARADGYVFEWSLHDWFTAIKGVGPDRYLEPHTVVCALQVDKRWVRASDFPFVERRVSFSATVLTADDRVVDSSRDGMFCDLNSHWLVMGDRHDRRTLRSLADLRPQVVPTGAALGALGETLWCIDPTTGTATMTEEHDTWTVPFPLPPVSGPEAATVTEAYMGKGAMLYHWRYEAPANRGQVDLAVAGYTWGEHDPVNTSELSDAHDLREQIQGRVNYVEPFWKGYEVLDATVYWRREGQTTAEPERYSAVWPGLPEADGTPVLFGIRGEWLVRLSPDGAQPIAEVGPALTRTLVKTHTVDQWAANGMTFFKSERVEYDPDAVDGWFAEVVVVVGLRVVTLPVGTRVRRHFEWGDRLYLQCDQGLYEVLPSGEARRFGTALKEDERLLDAQVQGDHLSLLVIQGKAVNDPYFTRFISNWKKLDKAWLADYDQEGRLLATRPYPILPESHIEFECPGVYILTYPVKGADRRARLVLDRQLQPYLPEGVASIDVVVPGSSAEAPGEWVLWLQRDGDHFLGDLHGTLQMDLPDTGLRSVSALPGAPTCWLLERVDGSEVLDASGASIVRLPGITGVERRIGDFWIYQVLETGEDMDVEKDVVGYHLVDAQGREQLDRTFEKVLQLTEQLLLVESTDEARYLRLPDLHELWRSKPGYAVTFIVDLDDF